MRDANLMENVPASRHASVASARTLALRSDLVWPMLSAESMTHFHSEPWFASVNQASLAREMFSATKSVRPISLIFWNTSLNKGNPFQLHLLRLVALLIPSVHPLRHAEVDPASTLVLLKTHAVLEQHALFRITDPNAHALQA